ncbi:MAG TPA: FimV/HubP family polar landmark protein [Burkholderiales bacterium]|jgi:hypothetical protein|nr:FimV/HubP family polar landmark protein [Burkholderiales bacterium]
MSEPDDAGPMLDLARSYMAMGDSEGARALLEELAAQGVDEARRMLEPAAANRPTESDEHAALEPRAKAGDAQAQYLLGHYYQRSLGRAGHLDLAIHWWSAAARQGHLDAMAGLGELLERHSRGEPERAQQGLAWLRRAADAGHAQAQHRLGVQLASGGEPANFPQAIGYLQQAAQQGLPEAAYDIGCVLLDPENPQADPAQGLAWLHQGANAGSIPALQMLARIHLQKGKPLHDRRKAAGYLEQAAGLGDYAACLELGNLLRSGIDGDPDFDGAERWLLEAQKDDQSGAAGRKLRQLYQEAALQTSDPSSKSVWLRKGAQAGDELCMVQLGAALLAADPAAAARWFQGAAAQGDFSAMVSLADLYSQGLGVPHDPWSATFWRGEAARRQSADDDAEPMKVPRGTGLAIPAPTDGPPIADTGKPAVELGLSFGWRRETGGLLTSESGYVLFEHRCKGVEFAPGLYKLVAAPPEATGLKAGDLVRTANGYGGKPYIVEVV